MTTLLHNLYIESQDIALSCHKSTNLGVERSGGLGDSCPLPLDHRHGNMEVSTANWIDEQLKKVIERKYDRITEKIDSPKSDNDKLEQYSRRPNLRFEEISDAVGAAEIENELICIKNYKMKMTPRRLMTLSARTASAAKFPRDAPPPARLLSDSSVSVAVTLSTNIGAT